MPSDDEERISLDAMLRAHKFLEGTAAAAAEPCNPNEEGPYHSRLCGKLRELFKYVIGLEEGPAARVLTSVPPTAAAAGVTVPPRPPLRITGHITRLIPGGPDAPDRVFMEPDAGSDLRYVDGMHRTGADELIVPASIEGRQIGALVTCELSNETDPKLTRLTIVA